MMKQCQPVTQPSMVTLTSTTFLFHFEGKISVRMMVRKTVHNREVLYFNLLSHRRSFCSHSWKGEIAFLDHCSSHSDKNRISCDCCTVITERCHRTSTGGVPEKHRSTILDII